MKIKYQNRIVAFIDVLGFSNIVYSDSTTLISKYFEYVLGDFKLPLNKSDFSCHLISDSIVISGDNNKENLSNLIELLCVLQTKLLYQGVLLRGGVSFGKLYLNKSKNILVGPGMINAFKLEAVAKYPRIIVDRKFISQYFDGTTSLIEYSYNSSKSNLIFTAPSPYISDYVYLDYLSFFAKNLTWQPFERVIELFKKYYYQNELIDKYEWLRIHILSSVTKSLKMLNEIEIKEKHVRRRILHLNKFINEFQKL